MSRGPARFCRLVLSDLRRPDPALERTLFEGYAKKSKPEQAERTAG